MKNRARNRGGAGAAATATLEPPVRVELPAAARGELVSVRVVDGVLERTIKAPRQWRSMPLELKKHEGREAAAGQGATYEFAFSSEQPVERWIPGVGYGIEVLGHAEGEADFTRLQDGGAWLDTHWGDQVGVSEDAWIADARGFTSGRFSKNERPQEIERDVLDEIRRNVSTGYDPIEIVLVRKGENGALSTYRVTKWVAYHVAFVGDPADATVGMGRNKDAGEFCTVVIRGGDPAREEAEMLLRNKVASETEPAGTAAPAARAAEPAAPATVAAPAVAPRGRASEIDEIKKLARENELPDSLYQDILERELTPEQARNVVSGWRAKSVQVQPQPSAERVFKAKDMQQYSLLRALAMSANLIRRDGIEAEVSSFFERNRPKEQSYSGGLFVPYRRSDLVDSRDRIEARHEAQMALRAMDASTKGQGAELLAPGLEFIDILRNATVLGPMKATFLSGLTAPIPFAKKTAATTFAWLGEGKAITPTDIKFIPLEMGPKRMGGAQDVGRELIIQASLDVENMVNTDMTDGPGVELDRGCLFGKGGAEPLGLFELPSSSGIQTFAVGGVPTWLKITQPPGKTARKNGLRGSLGWVTTPELATVMQGTPKTAGSSIFLWEGALDNGQVAGYRAMQSAQMRSNMGAGSDEHALVFGPWNHIIVGTWGGAELIVDPITQALNFQVRYVLNMLGNVICRYPEAFVLCTGAKTS